MAPKKKEDLMRGPNWKASTEYSPKPMSAAAKAKAKTAGATAQGKTGKLSPAQKKMFKELPKEGSRKPKAGSSTVSKVVKRAKTVAREVRDIPTAVATVVSSRDMGKYPSGKFAKKDLKTQIKEVGKAVVSGKKGTPAAQARYGSKPKGYAGAGGLDYNVSKPKKRK